ncbi:MAG: VCBS repeat-containing protein [Rhizobacter sp.]|nr:VCBS repeat-containing protein [Chlorobiales bacterium]
MDLLTANQDDENVSVRMGTGTGAFTGSTNIPIGKKPQSVATGDVNGDGKLDFVASNYDDGNVSVARGDGNGLFPTRTTVAVGTKPTGVALADIDNDGDLDLLVANEGSNTVSVRLGNGAGAFTGSTNISVGSYPSSIVVEDVNNDGKIDFLTANMNADNVSVRLGNGAGGFANSQTVSVGSKTYCVKLADVNGDGNLDFLTANEGGGSVSIALNAAAPVAGWLPASMPGNPSSSFNSIAANAQGSVTMVGDSGQIYVSPDGVNYVATAPDYAALGFAVPPDLKSVTIGSDFAPSAARKGSGISGTNGFGSAVAVGVGGTILRSADGGESWTQSTSSTSGDLLSVASSDGNAAKGNAASGTNGFGSAVAVGVGGTILRSEDQGQTWQTTNNTGSTATLNSVALSEDFVSAVSKGNSASGTQGFGSAVAVGVGGTILRSDDGGQSWISVPATESRTLTCIDYSGNSAAKNNAASSTNGFGSAVAVGVGGTILRSDDGGQSWISLSQSLNVYSDLQGVDMVDQNTWYVCGEHGIIYKTTNAGATWRQQASQTTQTMNAMVILPGGGGAIVGDYGTVFRFGNGSLATGGDQPTSVAPAAFTLSQNYPNPFNPSTTIRYSLPAASDVKLKIYDVLGKEVATLVNERKATGTYTANFNAAQFASGVYFYRLQAGTAVQTKKMLLVK